MLIPIKLNNKIEITTVVSFKSRE